MEWSVRGEGEYRLTCGPHVVAGNGRDNVIGGLLLGHKLGRRSEVLLQRGRVQTGSVTSRVHG